MPPNNATPSAYVVQLLAGSDLSAEQRAAAELRFRTTLEFALGGPEYVQPSLQAYRLAQALHATRKKGRKNQASSVLL